MKTEVPFGREVAAGRKAFFKEMRALPLTLRRNVVRNYEGRVARCKGKPLLGEYAPYFVADMIGLKNPRVVEEIMPAWLSLYSFTVFMDDILDKPGMSEVPETLIASSLLLERGLSRVMALLPKGGKVRVKIDEYFLEAAEAVMNELERHRRVHEEYSQRDVVALGKKVSLLKVCATYLFLADGRGSIDDDVLISVERLASGIQLLDDLTDWEEDWRRGTYTYLLQRTFSFLEKQGLRRDPARLGRDEVLLAMILSGSLEDCIQQGRGLLSDAIFSFRSRSFAVPPTFRFLLKVRKEQKHFREEIARTRKSLLALKPEKAFSTENWTDVIILRRDVKKKLRKIERHLEIVNQNT